MNRRTVLLSLVVLALIGGGVWAISHHFYHTSKSATTTTSAGGINLSPPTKEEKAETQAHKESLAQGSTSGESSTPSSNNPNSDQSAKNTVTPVITTYSQDSTQLTVNGFVEGVAENGGTCTLTLTRQGKTITHSRSAVINATNTSCGRIDIPLSELSAGTWQAALSYSSGTSQGSSGAKDITVTS